MFSVEGLYAFSLSAANSDLKSTKCQWCPNYTSVSYKILKMLCYAILFYFLLFDYTIIYYIFHWIKLVTLWNYNELQLINISHFIYDLFSASILHVLSGTYKCDTIKRKRKHFRIYKLGSWQGEHASCSICPPLFVR